MWKGFGAQSGNGKTAWSVERWRPPEGPRFYQVEPLWGWWRLWPEYSFLARDVISSMNSGVVYELSVFCLEHWENDIFGSLSFFRNLIFWETHYLPHYISWKLVKMDPQMDLETTFFVHREHLIGAPGNRNQPDIPLYSFSPGESCLSFFPIGLLKPLSVESVQG